MTKDQLEVVRSWIKYGGIVPREALNAVRNTRDLYVAGYLSRIEFE